MQQNPELPEPRFDASDFRLDGLIPTAKRGDTDLRPQIRRKDARSYAAFEEKAVRREKRILMTEAFFNFYSKLRSRCQNIDEVRNPENGVQLQIPAAHAAALPMAGRQPIRRGSVQSAFSLADPPAEMRQQRP
jgi:hypothetical protein